MKLFFIILVVSISATISSCSSNNKKSEQPEQSETVRKEKKDELGQYVYLDRAFVLHTKNGCEAVYKDHNMQVVRPVLIDNVTRNNLDRICSQCVTEGQLDFMMGYLKAKEEVYELAPDSTVDDYDPDTEP